MRYLLVLLLISGCTTTLPVTQKFPSLPETISSKCDELDEIEGETITLSGLSKTIATNYKKHHLCKSKHDEFLIWYDKQKKIFESVKVN